MDSLFGFKMMESHQDDSLMGPNPEPEAMKAATPWTADNIEKHVLKSTQAPDSTDSIICAANYGPYPHHLAICDASIPDTESKEIVNEVLVKLHPGNLDDIIPVFRQLAPLVLCERHNHPFERYLTRCRWTWNLAQENWFVAGVSPSSEAGHDVPEERQQEVNEEKENGGVEEGEIHDEPDDWESWGSDSSTFGYKEDRLRMWEDDLWGWQGELQIKEQVMKKRERALVRKEDQRKREDMLRILEGALRSWASSLRTREECLGRRMLEEDLERRRRSLDVKAGGFGLEGWWLLRLAYGWRESGPSISDLRGSIWFYYIVPSLLSVGIWLVWKYL